MYKKKNITNCRLCNNSMFQSLYSFGKLPLGNNLQSTHLKSINVKQYPLNLIRCKNCYHFQLDYSVSQSYFMLLIIHILVEWENHL